MGEEKHIVHFALGDRVRTKEGTVGTVMNIKRKYIEILGDGVWFGDYLPQELELIEEARP